MKTMSPHGEPSPPPSPRTLQKDSLHKDHKDTPPKSSTSRFISHLQTIPLVASTASLLPTPLTTSLSLATTLLVPPSLLTRADTVLDTALTHLEHSFPAIKTPTSTLTTLISRPLSILSTASNTYSTAAMARANTMKQHLFTAYQTRVEPLIGTYTDGAVKVLNDSFEGAVETGMPKSYREAVGESTGEEDTIELYRTARLARNALERGRVRFYVPLRGVAGKTMEDVVQGGRGVREEVRAAPERVRDGVRYVWRVVREETERETGGGVKRWGRVGYRVGERCAGEVVGVGLVVAAKGTGVVWGVWERVKM